MSNRIIMGLIFGFICIAGFYVYMGIYYVHEDVIKQIYQTEPWESWQ